MNSTEKLKLIFDFLGASNSELSKISGIDPSLVSRYRNGIRQPSLSSKQFLNLCDGMAKYAVEKSLWKNLYKLYGLPNAESPETALQKYICMPPDVEPCNSIHGIEPTVNAVNGFGEKLNLMMEVLNVSNVMLAKAICIDTSLVSRLKSGKRIPKKSRDLIESISCYILKRIKSLNMINELSIALGIPIEIIEKGSHEFIEMLSDWLLSTPDTTNINPYFAVDNLQMPAPLLQPKHAPDMNLIANIKPPMNTTKFLGDEGIQKALIALLNKVNTTDTPLVLKFFNDSNSDWLLNASPSYMATLSYLFTNANNNNKASYQIIHNLYRSTHTLGLGIQTWLPMYMTGLVEGYYYSTAPSEKFHHTLIIAQDTAAIFASHVAGTEKNCVYFYTEDPDIISHLDIQYNALLERSKPLSHKITRNNYKDYLLHLVRSTNSCITFKTLFKCPSINTMHPQLFSKIINSKSMLLSKGDKKQLIEYQRNYSHLQELRLKTNRIVEFIYFPDLNELAEQKVMLNLSEFLIKEQIPYSIDEYTEHIQHLLQLLKHENYHIVPLKGYPLDRLGLIIKEPSDASFIVNSDFIIHIDIPKVAVGLDSFLQRAVSNYMLPCHKKEDVIKFLNQYIDTTIKQ